MKCCNDTNGYVYAWLLRKLRLVTIMLFCLGYVVPGSAQRARQTPHKSPGGTRFVMYTPPGYSAGTPTPLLVVLHGGSSIGDTLTLLLNGADQSLPSKLIYDNKWDTSRPFIVLSPQLDRDLSFPNHNDQEWAPAKVNEVVEYVKTLRNIDANRMYFTGISLGGAGCWSYAAVYPNKVAGLVVASGKTDVTQACLLKNIPIWVFHGASDGLVPTSFSTNMVNAINACSPHGVYMPRLNMLEANAHEGWNGLYDSLSYIRIYKWLLRYSKTDLGNKPPYVSAGPNLKLLSRTEPLHITGDFFDFEGSVASVQWTQIGGAALTLDGVNTKYLKLTNLVPGVFQFRLTATDNLGLSASSVMQLTLLSSGGTAPIVTGLTLTNRTNTSDLMVLSEGAVINKATLGMSVFNIRATTANNAQSATFSINYNHAARERINPNNPFLIGETGVGWTMQNGDYTVCVTPYSERRMEGTIGTSLCYKITVVDEVVTIKNFYSKPSVDLSLLSSWGTNTNGTGTAPTSFTANQQIFNISNAAILNNSLTISGTGSSLWVRNGGTLTINSSLSAAINTQGNAIVHVSTSQPVTFGTVDNASMVNFNMAATGIPAGTYGNLAIKGAGSTKTLTTGNTIITGNLTIDNDVTVNGAASNNSVIQLSGNFTLSENDVFNPSTKFALQLVRGAAQALNFSGTRAVFNQLTLSSNTVATLTGPAATTTLELGASNGGGLIVNNNAQLLLGKNHLSITGQGTLNGGNQTGRIAFKKSSLQINAQSATNSHLYTLTGSDSLRALTMNLTSGGQLFIDTKTYITDSVKCTNGIIQSNGNLALVATPALTARLAAFEGNGNIQGEIEYQRLVMKGRKWRYASFPISGLTISEVQPFIPITGGFLNSSTGPGLSSAPSLFLYDNEAWVAYPTTNNLAPLDIGKGYSIFVREEVNVTKLILKGGIHRGNFSFTLDPDPSASANDGWNLIGNPYASPIQWNNSSASWLKSGVNQSVYVRDNTVALGRFLVWDGTDGDPEFGGRIAQGQAFWVRATTASPTLTILEPAKINVEAAMFREKSTGTPTTLVVELQQGDLLDRTYLKFNHEGNDSFDSERDAVKQKNGYFNLSTLSNDAVQLAIDNLSDSFCDKLISLSIDSTAAGNYSLFFRGAFFDQPIGSIVLQDNYTDAASEIQANSRYDFSITSDPLSYGNGRFQLHVQNDPGAPVVSISQNQLSSSMEEGNQWLLNGEVIEGATESTYVPIASGEYQVRVKNGACERTSEVLPFIVTGITQTEIQNLKIYPNPTSGDLYIKGNARAAFGIQYTIINAMGTESQQGEIQSADLQEGLALKIGSLPPGVYILRLDNQRTPQRFRFVIE